VLGGISFFIFSLTIAQASGIILCGRSFLKKNGETVKEKQTAFNNHHIKTHYCSKLWQLVLSVMLVTVRCIHSKIQGEGQTISKTM
jgi:hypothetical protein